MIQRIKDKGKSGIYMIINTISGKVYIGKAKCIHRRIKAHVTALNTKSKDENRHLINSWHKYGRDSFCYSVIEYTNNEDSTLMSKEIYWMDIYSALNNQYGYNMRKDSSSGMIVSDETRQKLSNAQIKRFEDPKERINVGKASAKFWKDNPDIKKEMAKAVSKVKEKYDFLQYDRDGNFIKSWSSIKSIIANNLDYKWQNIYAVCNGYKPTYMGYVWKKQLKI